MTRDGITALHMQMDFPPPIRRRICSVPGRGYVENILNCPV